MARYDRDISGSGPRLARRIAPLAIILAIILFLLGLNGRKPLEGARKPAETVTAKVLNVVNMPVRGAENLISDMGDHFATVEKLREAEAETARLRIVEQDFNAAKAEIKYLQNIFGTQIQTDLYKSRIGVRAVSEQNGPFIYSALLNAGTKKGIKKGQAVLTAEGMYGHVIRAGRGSARALSLRDLNSRIPVLNIRSRERAIMQGDNRSAPELKFVGDGDWASGDEVVTSGDDGVLPRGLPIGRVIGTGPDKLRVKLYAKDAIDWMWVQPFTPIAPPENTPDEGAQP